MRRRLWCVLYTFDTLYSVAVNVPTTIHESECPNLRIMEMNPPAGTITYPFRNPKARWARHHRS
ncbi:hypothetical protein BC829DRAFT_389943, partial [Chytridium lagenaria]